MPTPMAPDPTRINGQARATGLTGEPSASRSAVDGRLGLVVLDLLRGLTALYVVVHHARWLLWMGTEEFAQTDPSVFGRALAAASSLFRFGALPVMLFFLISGFCIHYRQATALVTADRGQSPALLTLLEPRGYAWRRLRRIYPPLLAALGLTALLDAIGASLNPAYYFGNTRYATIDYYLFSGVDHVGPATLLGNLLIQGNLAVPTYGTNVALWSLSLEAWYYLAYPLLLWLRLRIGPGPLVAAVGAISLIGTIGLEQAPETPIAWLFRIAVYWIVWVGGLLLAEWYVAVRRSRLVLALLTITSALVFLALAINHQVEYILLPLGIHAYAWSLGLFTFLALLLFGLPARARHALESLAGRLRFSGDLSYSLYLVHTPWLALLSAWWLTTRPQLPAGAELALGGILGAVIVATLFWYLVERHCLPTHRSQPARALRSEHARPPQPARLPE